jgi:tRNA-2-methylthio-N6-dimethylallyladenosine synthase
MSDAPNIYIETYGCQMNEYDSELVKSILAKGGFGLTDSLDEAEVVLLNTCAVRERAHLRIYGRLQGLKREKAMRGERGLTVGILGCMAQNLKDDLLDGYDTVDFIAGPDSYRELPSLIDAARGGATGAAALKLSRTETYTGVDPIRGAGVNAWIAVMRGCDNMCTFCVVPFTRGRERSRDPEDVVDEVKALVKQGYRQVTLLGQNVNSYKRGDHHFADLMRMVGDVPGVDRVRFTSTHPKDFPADLIRAIAEHPNLCSHVHLPLQAGNDRVLDLMRRTYTNREFRDLVDEMRATIPDLGLTTDVIVGFPSETAEEYEETRQLMEDVRFDAAFIFKYSQRKGTYAERKLPDDVAPDDKTRRIVELVELQKKITGEINQSLVGSVQSVLLEDPHEKDGYTCRRRRGRRYRLRPCRRRPRCHTLRARARVRAENGRRLAPTRGKEGITRQWPAPQRTTARTAKRRRNVRREHHAPRGLNRSRGARPCPATRWCVRRGATRLRVKAKRCGRSRTTSRTIRGTRPRGFAKRACPSRSSTRWLIRSTRAA